MARWLPGEKTAALEALSAEVFGDLKFDAFRTDMGIVATRWTEERPIIFKTNPGTGLRRESHIRAGLRLHHRRRGRRVLLGLSFL